MLDEAIAEKLVIEKFSSTPNTFCIAAVGCSVGPNTFITKQNILEAMGRKYESKALASKLPEFQVFFNDHATNAFNTLFTTFPPKKCYFAAGVTGSFHSRLFPKSSLHIVHASYALHWLSKMPEEVQDKDSPTWNKGRIYYTRASGELANAYAAQFSKDMDNFLNFRATEIVVGGMILLVMTVIQDGLHRSQSAGGFLYDELGSSLMDMEHEALISEALINTFILHVYTTTMNEIARLVERNGCFNIERMKLTDPILNVEGPVDVQMCTMHIRAAVEGVLTKHFGSEIIDEIFTHFYQKAAKYPLIESKYKKRNLLFLALKRN
ncbi:LAMT/FAMT [Ilex paraguariensis]|uniref:LAMT/FAMT protein n=1 Tax=Ilex paraguariensis TaxID=185542 RepID=A0ABC8RKE4_9AQUA